MAQATFYVIAVLLRVVYFICSKKVKITWGGRLTHASLSFYIAVTAIICMSNIYINTYLIFKHFHNNSMGILAWYSVTIISMENIKMAIKNIGITSQI